MLRWCKGLFAIVVEDKGIVMDGDIKFCEKVVTGLTGKYVLDLRDGIYFTFDSFVKSTKVGYPTDCVVFLGDDKGTTYPRGSTSRGKDIDLNEPIEFGFELC